MPGILWALAMNLIASNLNLRSRHGQLHDQLPSMELSDLPLVLDFQSLAHQLLDAGHVAVKLIPF